VPVEVQFTHFYIRFVAFCICHRALSATLFRDFQMQSFCMMRIYHFLYSKE